MLVPVTDIINQFIKWLNSYNPSALSAVLWKDKAIFEKQMQIFHITFTVSIRPYMPHVYGL